MKTFFLVPQPPLIRWRGTMRILIGGNLREFKSLILLGPHVTIGIGFAKILISQGPWDTMPIVFLLSGRILSRGKGNGMGLRSHIMKRFWRRCANVILSLL